MSISGSSWNSLIFTVSDKILLRFLRSSSTWEKTQKRKVWVRNTINNNTAVMCESCSIPARAAECSASPCPPLRRPGWCGASASSIPPGSLTTCRPARPETWWPASSLWRSSDGDTRDRSERQRLAFRSVYLPVRQRFSDVKTAAWQICILCDYGFSTDSKHFFFFFLLMQAGEKNGKQSVAKQGILTYKRQMYLAKKKRMFLLLALFRLHYDSKLLSYPKIL